MTHKQTYLRNLSLQSDEWITSSAADPSRRMTRTHVLLHLIELRRRGRIQSYWAGVARNEGWA